LSWIADNWRLKLLAVGLAVVMLTAVAFSQNPPTVKTIQANIYYSLPDGLVLIDPPVRTAVTVNGLADVLKTVSADNVTVTVDLAKVQPGTSVRVNPKATAFVNGVMAQTQPIALNIDSMESIALPVTVRLPRGQAPGWQVTKAEARCPPNVGPCTVNFDGPKSWETNLKAFADFPTPVENSTYDVLTQPVVLVQNGSVLDLSRRTVPTSGLDTATVSIHVEAKTGTSSRQVVLIDAPPSHGPPPGYRITGISVDPATVLVSGSPEAVAKVTTITLPALDLSSRTSDATFRVQINYPDGVTGPVKIATVTYSISPNPNTQPTPSP